jgi:hypothetical protein
VTAVASEKNAVSQLERTHEQLRADLMIETLDPLWLRVLYTRHLLAGLGFVCAEELCELQANGDVIVNVRLGAEATIATIAIWLREPDEFLVDRAAATMLVAQASPEMRAVGFERAIRAGGVGNLFDEIAAMCAVEGLPHPFPAIGPCTHCGNGMMRALARAGRTRRARGGAQMPIPSDLPIPTCDGCGVEEVDRETAKKLAALDAPTEFRVTDAPILSRPLVPAPSTVPRLAPEHFPMSARAAEDALSKLPSNIVKAFICREMAMSLGFTWNEVDIVTLDDVKVGISITRGSVSFTLATGEPPAGGPIGEALDHTIADGYRAWNYAFHLLRERYWYEQGGEGLLRALEVAMRSAGLTPGPPPPERLN